MIKQTVYQNLVTKSTRYTQLKEMLNTNDVAQDWERFTALSKECSQLKPIHEGLTTYQQLQASLHDNAIWLDDQDPMLKTLALEEQARLTDKITSLLKELETILIPGDPDDQSNVFLEIRAAAGGAEASLFAGDLLRMYLRYAEEQRWTVEIISSHPSEQGGYKEVILKLIGPSVYAHLKFESGAHRVQRVPATEAQGRLHTSTCTVAVFPETEAVEKIMLNPDEIRIDTFRASGAGGQHVQKTDSAIRITHLATGVKVECQDERSQHKNRERALSLLKARLLAASREKQQQEEAATRRNLVGTGQRSERIRTYNIPQGRLTDHRIPLTLYQLETILNGKLSLILEPLKKHHQLQELSNRSP